MGPLVFGGQLMRRTAADDHSKRIVPSLNNLRIGCDIEKRACCYTIDTNADRSSGHRLPKSVYFSSWKLSLCFILLSIISMIDVDCDESDLHKGTLGA
jgi:hypothetical protein